LASLSIVASDSHVGAMAALIKAWAGLRLWGMRAAPAR
jgi:hypothetical protein